MPDTEIRLRIVGVKYGKEFVSGSHEFSMDLAEAHQDRLLRQTGLPDWQPNIISVEIETREVTPWKSLGVKYSAEIPKPTDLEGD